MKKILLIEDNKEMRENTAELLELSNYMVFTAENGKVGVEMAKEKSSELDIILCDIMMPESDGYGVLHILSKLNETQNIPFIFLSAKSEKQDFRAGMNLGASDYLSKPFTEIELLTAIENRINKNSHVIHSKEGTYLKRVKAGKNELSNAFDGKKTMNYPKKNVIFHEGDSINYVHLIKSGKVKLYNLNEDGKEMIQDILLPGDFFDFTSLFNNVDYLISAQAMDDVELQILQKEEFMELSMNQNVCNYLNHENALKSQSIQRKLMGMAYDSVRKRVANGLLFYFDKKYVNEDEINVSRDDIANVVGTSTESVIRTLHDFREENLIQVVGRKILLKDKQGLVNIRS